MPDTPATTTLTLREAVNNSLSNLGGRIRDEVVEHFAAQKATTMAQALIKGLDKLTELERELNKVRPQITTFDENDQPVGTPTYTKDQVEQRKKLREQIEKLTKAITKADEQNDFGDLLNAAK